MAQDDEWTVTQAMEAAHQRVVQAQEEDMVKSVDKEYSGSSLSPLPTHSLIQFDKESSPLMSYGSKANKRLAQLADTCTSNAVSPSARRNLCREFKECLEPESTANSQEVKPLLPTAPKKIRELASRLNMEHVLSEETKSETGSPSGYSSLVNDRIQPEVVTLTQSRPTFEWYLTVPSGRLPATSLLASQLFDMLRYFGELLVLENHDVLGMKQDSMLMLRIQEPSFGMVTNVKQMLSSMNFEEESTLRICLDGLTVIRCVWKSKDQRDRRLWKRSGSHPMWTQTFGTLN